LVLAQVILLYPNDMILFAFFLVKVDLNFFLKKKKEKIIVRHITALVTFNWFSTILRASFVYKMNGFILLLKLGMVVVVKPDLVQELRAWRNSM